MKTPLFEEGLRSSPAALRNREPIDAVLQSTLQTGAHVLEIASGTGEHAAYFARDGRWSWQCSDGSQEALSTIAHWTRGASGVTQPPIEIDVTRDDWAKRAAQSGSFDALYCANMIHIAPPEATAGLIMGAQQLLRPGGVLILYGPFRFGQHHSAPSNEAFDASLKARDPRWGLRDLGTVVETMRQHQLVHQHTHKMPANNLCVVFQRSGKTPTPLPE